MADEVARGVLVQTGREAFKGSLSDALALAAGLNEFDYTAASWGTLAAAVAYGQTVLADEYAGEFLVDKATRDILAAIDALELFPLQLFAAAQEGAWLSQEDTGTLFVDGATPVTVDGQAEGLILDKRLGLPLGAEDVTNGDFSTGDFTGWTLVGAAHSVVDGRAVIDGAGGSNAGIYQDVTVSPGAFVKVSIGYYALVAGLGGRAFLYDGANFSSSLLFINPLSEGEFYVGPVTSGVLRIRLYAPTTESIFEIDDVSAKQVDTNAAYQTTSLAKVTFNDDGVYQWASFDGNEDAILFDVPAGGWNGTYVQGTMAGVIVGEISVPAGAYQIPTNPVYANSRTMTELVIRDDGGVIDPADLEQLVGYAGRRGAVADFAGETSAQNWFRDRSDLKAVDISRWDISALTDWAGAFTNTNLSQQSYTDLVTAIEAAGTSNGTLDITGGSATTTGAAQTAVDALRARGWTVTTPDGY